MVGPLAGQEPVPLVSDDLGKVLHEVAAESDVQYLRASADGQHRHVPLERGLEDSAISARSRPSRTSVRLGMWLGAVVVGIEIGAAGEDDAVEHGQRLLDRVLARRHDERPAAGLLDRANVRERHERRRLDPGPP